MAQKKSTKKTTTKPAAKTGDEREPTFEEAVERIEAIIERIEAGEIGLEDSIQEFERGMRLIKSCRASLDRAEQRVKELLGDEGDGDEPS